MWKVIKWILLWKWDRKSQWFDQFAYNWIRDYKRERKRVTKKANE